MFKSFQFIAILLIVSFFVACNQDSDDPPGEEDATIEKFTSIEFGLLESGSGESIQIIPGTVPVDDSGNAGTISFTIDIDVEAPKELRDGGDFIGKLVKFGPEYFNFNWPVQMTLPYDENEDPRALYVLNYDYTQEKWMVLNKTGIDTEKKLIYFNTQTLGVFGVAKLSEDFRDLEWADGGFRFKNPHPDYFYTITIAERTNMKYPNQLLWNGANSWILGSTGTRNNKPLDYTWVYAFQADYKLWISRVKIGTYGELPGLSETYSIPITASLTEACVCPLSATTFPDQNFCEPWVDLTLSSGGTWVEGRPDNWAVPTQTYGTGDFQATLNWINTSERSTDLDLHLYGPDGMHVYYEYPISPGSELQLDRDWLGYVGNAVENIYSLKEMPKGAYQVKVNLFDGAPTDYNVRVIRFGTVNNFSGSLSVPGEEVLLDEFTL